jgi:hypothetical protein
MQKSERAHFGPHFYEKSALPESRMYVFYNVFGTPGSHPPAFLRGKRVARKPNVRILPRLWRSLEAKTTYFA